MVKLGFKSGRISVNRVYGELQNDPEGYYNGQVGVQNDHVGVQNDKAGVINGQV